jgi:hypothetical protein
MFVCLWPDFSISVIVILAQEKRYQALKKIIDIYTGTRKLPERLHGHVFHAD